jgi:ABC-type antimicrobial peptide transport system permease subunit
VHVTIGATAGQSPVMSVLLAMALAASLVLIVGIVACAIPTRRILAVEASEAVRSNG